MAVTPRIKDYPLTQNKKRNTLLVREVQEQPHGDKGSTLVHQAVLPTRYFHLKATPVLESRSLCRTLSKVTSQRPAVTFAHHLDLSRMHPFIFYYIHPGEATTVCRSGVCHSPTYSGLPVSVAPPHFITHTTAKFLFLKKAHPNQNPSRYV